MRVPSEKKALEHVAEHLAQLLDVHRDKVRVSPGSGRRGMDFDAAVKAGPFTFAVELKSSGRAASVAGAVEQVLGYCDRLVGDKWIPLIVVPFMGDAGRRRCEQAGISWMDLSGNARIVAPGLRIMIDGNPNRYKRPGRPSTVFAPKSSRIVRWLLMHPLQPITQRELALATEMDEGYTSRIVGRLEDDHLVVRDEGGAVRPADPDLLLDAWRDAYDFTKHHLVRGHVAARTGDALLGQLAAALEKASTSYASTGLAAAWLLDRFAGFRTVSLYLAREPSAGLLEALSFREDDRGANTWLVVPNDGGVFHGAKNRDGIRCVHPVQAWLDLHAHPERAVEAAQTLRERHLKWRSDDG